MRKTKIVCTLGPSIQTYEDVKDLIRSGMDVARINMSHGDYASYAHWIDMVKDARAELEVPVAILLDTKGPEIRIGVFEKNTVTLKDGELFVLTTKPVVGNAKYVSLTNKKLPKILKPKDKILLNDGLVELKVLEIEGTEIVCKIVHGGELSNHKSLNIPGIPFAMEFLTEADKKDLEFCATQDIDYLALSFVNCKKDVEKIKSFLEKLNMSQVKLISKIESAEGVKNMNEIIASSDGVMVARGDLGVEIEFTKIPAIQKQIIAKCNQAGKSVITATQMLESMTQSSRPTRAEISDVANAVLDGTSAVMLSGETAKGKYPFLACKTMAKIVQECEKEIDTTKQMANNALFQQENLSKSMGYAAVSLSYTTQAKAILVVTFSGKTAGFVAQFKPKAPIIASTPKYKTYHQMALLWGVKPMLNKICENTDQLLESARTLAKQAKLVKEKDIVVQTAGVPVGESAETNLLKVDIIS